MVRLEPDFRVIELARDPEEIGRNLVRATKPTEVHVEEPQVDNRWGEISRAVKAMPNLGSPLYRFAHLRRRPPVYAHQGCTELRQNCQFGMPALGCFRLSVDQRQSAAEVLDRFAICRAAYRLLTCFAPIDDRLARPAGILQMMGYDLRR